MRSGAIQMPTSFRILISCLAILASTGDCLAQRFTVQQPVISQFGASTTVSVPDRGAAFLGGVSRQGFSRYSTGPFHPGSSIGRFTESRGASVSVYVHDFEELERQLLAGDSSSQRIPYRNVAPPRIGNGLRRTRPQSRANNLVAGQGQETNDLARDTAARAETSAEPPPTSITDTDYGRARMARRRNLDRALYGTRSYK